MGYLPGTTYMPELKGNVAGARAKAQPKTLPQPLSKSSTSNTAMPMPLPAPPFRGASNLVAVDDSPFAQVSCIVSVLAVVDKLPSLIRLHTQGDSDDD